MLHQMRISAQTRTYSMGTENTSPFGAYSNIIQLTSGGDVQVEDYNMQVPNTRENFVYETIRVRISGPDPAIRQMRFQEIEYILDTASPDNQWSNRFLVALEMKPDGYPEWYRSQIVYGRIELVQGTLFSDHWANNYILCNVFIQRVPYWETSLFYDVGVYQGYNYIDAYTAMVFNSIDGVTAAPYTRINGVLIPNTSVVGDLPAPLRVNINPVSGFTNKFDILRVASRIFEENESGSTYTKDDGGVAAPAGWTTVANANYMSGNYYTKTITETSYPSTPQIQTTNYYSINTTVPGWKMLIGRFDGEVTYTGDIKCKAVVYLSDNGTVIQTVLGEFEVVVDSRIIFMGSFYIPRPKFTVYYSPRLYVQFFFKQTGTANPTVAYNGYHVSAEHSVGYAIANDSGLGLTLNQNQILDYIGGDHTGYTGASFSDSPAFNYWPGYFDQFTGKGVFVYPNRWNLITFNGINKTGYTNANQCKVGFKYRPRRRTL